MLIAFEESMIEFTMKNPLFYLKTRRKGLKTIPYLYSNVQ
jgi:hypothetical protein